jgi:PAS domain S-box-containing protein
MKQLLDMNKEIRFILFYFILIFIFIAGKELFNYHELNKLHSITSKIYEHPFRVSNAALNVKVNIYKIRKLMTEIVLYKSKSKSDELLQEIKEHEKNIYQNLIVIEKNILGESGLKLQQETLKLFKDWKKKRDNITLQVASNIETKLIDITKSICALHADKIEIYADKLYSYASKKSEEFRNSSIETADKLKTIIILVDVVFLFLFIGIVYYIIYRISEYINTNSRLKSVLTVVRSIDELIVRETEFKKLIQESCTILTSNYIYLNAWISLTDNNNKITDIISAEDSEDFTLFKEKIESGWIPDCIEKSTNSNECFSYIENIEICNECPMSLKYKSKSAFNIELVYKEKKYGYLTLTLDSKDINNKEEFGLLNEVAGDMAYAFYNIEMQSQLIEKEKYYRELFNKTPNIIILTNIDSGQLYDVNNTFEKILGYKREEVVGKTTLEFDMWTDINQRKIFAEKLRKDGSVEKMIARINTKDKNVLIFELNANIVSLDYTDYMLAVLTDITEQKKAEDTIVYLKELYDSIINSVDNLIFVKDLNFNYITCNRAFEKFVGISKDDLIGKSDYDVFDKEIAVFFRGHDKQMLVEKQSKSNFEWVTYPDGSKSYLLTIKAPLLDSNGDIIGLVGNSTDVTEQERTLKALKEAQSLAKIGSWEYDIIEDILVGTEEVYNIFGFSDLNMKLNKNSFFEQNHPDDLETAEEDFRNSLNSKDITVSHNRIIRKNDGEIRYLEHRWIIEYDNDIAVKAVGTTQDITEKINNINLLEHKTKELETIIKEAPTPIILHSEDGKISMLNQAWIDSCGYSIDDTPTIDSFMELVFEDPDTKASVKEHVRSLYSITSKVDEGEFTFLTKRGDHVTWQFSSAPLGVIDGKRTIISSAMDVTELKKKDEMMMAQSRAAAIGDMISMIAHQWRQPISVIAMSANNMLLDIDLDSLDKDEIENESKLILEQTEHLSKTIDDFRDFFKPEKEKERESVSYVVYESIKMMSKSLENNSIRYNVNSTTDEKVMIFTRELLQVFINILKNAKETLVENQNSGKWINIDIIDDGGYIKTKICNNGGQIPPSDIVKIFDPYFSTKSEQNGIGLSLYTSKLIIEKHMGGELSVENTDDGVCFFVNIPRDKVDE